MCEREWEHSNLLAAYLQKGRDVSIWRTRKKKKKMFQLCWLHEKYSFLARKRKKKLSLKGLLLRNVCNEIIVLKTFFKGPKFGKFLLIGSVHKAHSNWFFLFFLFFLTFKEFGWSMIVAVHQTIIFLILGCEIVRKKDNMNVAPYYMNSSPLHISVSFSFFSLYQSPVTHTHTHSLSLSLYLNLMLLSLFFSNPSLHSFLSYVCLNHFLHSLSFTHTFTPNKSPNALTFQTMVIKAIKCNGSWNI